MTAEELNDFTAQGLLGPIGDAADTVLGFDDALDKATGRLNDFNLPTGFRRAALAFQSGSLGPDLQPGGPALAPDPSHPPRVKGGDGAALPMQQSLVSVQPGGVVIHIDGARDPQAVAEAVADALRRLGHVQSGDTMQAGIR